jgi:SAM-dependent methyltransferase
VSASPPAPGFSSLLYAEPRLYDLVFPDPDDLIGRMCREAFRRYGPAAPASVLDIGCGTGRHLEALAASVPEAWGVDLLESNVAYARAARPRLYVVQGDMRAVRLGRTFDVITSFGNALSYALSDADLARTVATYAAHAHRDTLLIVDALSAKAYLDGGGFRERIEARVDTPEFQATSVALHTLDRDARILTRRRTWDIAGRPPVEDRAEYRLLYPAELGRLLESGGLQTLAMFDNREFRPSDLAGSPADATDPGGMAGRKLYALARLA